LVELESELGGNISHRSDSPLGSPKMALEETCSRVPPPYLSLPPGPTNPLDKKNPSGKTMLDRANKIGDMVLDVLKHYPQSRGDHMLVWLGVLRRYYWKLVRISTKPTLQMTWVSFDAFFYCPSFESCRRRAQEWQHDEKERIWMEVAAQYPELLVQYGNDVEWRENELAVKAFLKLAKKSDILPMARTIRKRMRNESVHEKYFTDRQLGLEDFEGD